MKRLRRIAKLERFGSSVATRRELEMPLNPAFKRWAKLKGRYASKTKMNQYDFSGTGAVRILMLRDA